VKQKEKKKTKFTTIAVNSSAFSDISKCDMARSMLHTFVDLAGLSPQQIRHRFGGKLLGLYEAYQLGIAIPTTLMLSAQDHEAFLETDPGEDVGEFERKAADFVRGKGLEGLEEGLYAVRSSCQAEDSASHSFAGIFETKLNVPREEIPEAIGYVWGSVMRERAKSYSQSRSLMGVVIQPMIEAKYAGVCFTANPSPTTIFENGTLVVEFAEASGEKVVGGEVIPFRLTGTPDVLSAVSENGWMNELLKTVFELKKRYHHEADIEFAVDKDDDFWLLQQRPISRVCKSHALDLSNYRRMYKRSLCSLDIELLIDGCSRFLAPYLEVPICLDRWMVMTTSTVQELWVDEVLNETVLRAVIDKIEHDPNYLPRLEARYAEHYQRLIGPQPSRLFEWFEWIAPLSAHYYVPMFVIDALYTSILREIRSIDPLNAEKDLFELATSGIASLVDLLNQELRAPHPNLKQIAERFGFMKCRQPFEDPYSVEELKAMIPHVPDPVEGVDLSHKQKKYFQQEHLAHRLNRLREWMRIRNQEMEYLSFAYLGARPLITSNPEIFWRSSKASLLQGSQPPPIANLAILQLNGQTVLSDQIEIRLSDIDRFTDLKGRTVYGKGILEATVLVAFTPEELTPPTRPCVLVTGMTTPDFVPLIRRHFDALITDEGGILCHAAIVAREIPISCIVGTGSASEILKDGMRVRIDFDRGDIEILV
jgi:phosphohistidine swiveling domain-containing protein